MNIDRHDQPEPARVLSGPLGLSAYRHKNLANRTVIDLMVFLFKKKRRKRKKGKRQAKSKNETREISYWKALWHARYTHSDTHTHTHSQAHTSLALTSKGPGSASASTWGWGCIHVRSSVASFELQVKSNEKTHRWKLKQKWQMVYFSPLFLFAFWESAGLGPGGGCMEPGRMSLQGRGWTINKRLTSIDFAAGKKGNSWVCLSTICLAFTSFFSFAFALFSLLCLSHTLFLTLSFFLDLRLMEKNCVLMRRQLYLPSLGVYFLASCLWYIWRLWSFKLLSIMHNYLKYFFSSLSLFLSFCELL